MKRVKRRTVGRTQWRQERPGENAATGREEAAQLKRMVTQVCVKSLHRLTGKCVCVSTQ